MTGMNLNQVVCSSVHNFSEHKWHNHAQLLLQSMTRCTMRCIIRGGKHFQIWVQLTGGETPSSYLSKHVREGQKTNGKRIESIRCFVFEKNPVSKRTGYFECFLDFSQKRNIRLTQFFFHWLGALLNTKTYYLNAEQNILPQHRWILRSN